MRSDTKWLRGVTIGVVATLALGACGGSTATTAPPATSAPAATSAPVASASAGGASVAPSTAPASTAPTGTKGGTIYILTQSEQWNQVDPQRAYTGEDMAFFSATIYRSLTAYKLSPDQKEGTSLTPDLATDLGTATNGGKTWAFTLRDGVTFQDGSPITCADVKYGVSRTFAIDVINQGPTYAIAYLDIPSAADGSSEYKGPYKKTGQDLYDKAVTCSADNKTITFNLIKAIADFNYTVTLGFSPVPQAADTGETYGSTVLPVSSGPYKVDSYTTGNGGKMLLSRNENWSQASDPYRTPYPDKWEVDFGIDPKVIDQRIMQSAGNDAYAVQYGNVQPENLSVVFKDAETANPDYANRAISGFDPYSRYYFINVQKVKNVKIRQAMAVALDRSAIRLNIGGAFAGSYADGVVKPNIGADYAPTGLWDTFFGQPVPDTGDPVLAKKLITESGEAAPKLTFNFADTPVNQKTAAIVIDSLGKAGITVTPGPIEAGKYYSVVFDPASAGEFGMGGWGADWPNASTVIPPLFTVKGGWDLSQLDDPAFNAKVDAALTELDRTKQEGLWQALNKEAAENMYAIPTFFGLSQTIAGSKIAPAYRWAAYGSWPYGALYVTP
ncbi:MAG TPA: ABC transporter substrate-binding protein [Candidatus Limnocylindrales bacterium]